MRLPNAVRRDYYLFVLFSGLRRQSAAEMQWQHVNLDDDDTTLTVPNPKEGSFLAHLVYRASGQHALRRSAPETLSRTLRTKL